MNNNNYQQYLPLNWSNTIFQSFEWHSGDVVISSGAKQGSTWVVNIVHHLRTGGIGDFDGLLDECPRPEAVEYPGQPDTERLQRWEHGVFKKYAFRVIKTHASPPTLPFQPEVKYIIPVRNSKDTLVSFYFFRNNTTEEFRALWGGRPSLFPSFDVCFEWYLELESYWKFLNNWLPYRQAGNVLFIHYADLKRDLPGNIEKIADFLNIDIAPLQRECILEKCGFQWMRDNSDKFEEQSMGKHAAMIKSGGMIRKGNSGEHSVWFSPEQEARWDALHYQQIPDNALRVWCDEGGDFPV